jgi:uncharacterized membrane protein YgdD (TMEM256/DUF423 family)
MSPFIPIHSWLWYAGCFTCAASIAFGAAGGHKVDWPQWKKDNHTKAMTLGLVSGIGILLSSMVSKSPIPGILFMSGTVGFCGPMYWKNFTDDTSFAKFTPMGGSAMIGAWILLAFM